MDNIVRDELASAGINPGEIIHNDTFCQAYNHYKSGSQSEDSLYNLIDKAEIIYFGENKDIAGY